MIRGLATRLAAALLPLACSAGTAAAADVPPAVLAGLLSRIEQQYPAFFPGPQADRRSGSITYRSYPSTGNSVGHDGVDLYAMGPVVGSAQPVKVMPVVAFCNATPQACGVAYERQLVVAGTTRDYLVYVSWKAASNGSPPLVVMFHGSGQGGPYAYENFGWKQVADTEGLVVAYPSGLKYCYYEDKDHDGRITFDVGRDVR